MPCNNYLMMAIFLFIYCASICICGNTDGYVGDITLEEYAQAKAAQRAQQQANVTTASYYDYETASEPPRIVSEAELSSVIFDGYVKTRRPRKDAQQRVDVYFGLSLIALNQILEREQEMQVTVLMTLQWSDDYLVWKHLPNFTSITSLSAFANEVWIPDFSNVNSGNMYQLHEASEKMLVSIDPTGLIEWLPEATISNFCDLDMTYFPFDVQHCPIRFEAWTYFPEQEMFQLYNPPTNIHKYKSNEQWELIDLTVRPYISCYTNSTTDCCYTGIEFVVHVRRKAAYYNINIIVPSLIIAIVELVVFTLPTHEPQKIHISFTCLLAYAVFQDTVSREMPRASDHVPLLSIFINLQMAYIGVALMGEACVFMCINRAARRQAPNELLIRFGILLGRWLNIDPATITMPEETARNDSAAESAMNEWQNQFMSAEQLMTSAFAEEPAQTPFSDEKTLSYSGIAPPPQHRQQHHHHHHHHYFHDSLQTHSNVKMETIHLIRFQWLYLAEVSERIAAIVYLMLIVVTPIVIFVILPALYD